MDGDVMYFKTTKEMFKAGYGIGLYNISTDKEVWRFEDETITTPVNSFEKIANCEPFALMADIEEIRKHAING